MTAPSAEGAFWGSRVCGRGGGLSSVMRAAHDSSFCGRSLLGEPRLRMRDFASAEATKGLCDRPLETFARSSLQLCGGQRRKVAAALSAAVTITKPIGDELHLQAESPKKKGGPQTPAALRERGSGGEALLSEKRPLPQNLPPIAFPGGSAREGPFAERPPPSHPPLRPYFSKEATVWVFSKSKVPVSVLAFLM